MDNEKIKNKSTGELKDYDFPIEACFDKDLWRFYVLKLSIESLGSKIFPKKEKSMKFAMRYRIGTAVKDFGERIGSKFFKAMGYRIRGFS